MLISGVPYLEPHTWPRLTISGAYVLVYKSNKNRSIFISRIDPLLDTASTIQKSHHVQAICLLLKWISTISFFSLFFSQVLYKGHLWQKQQIIIMMLRTIQMVITEILRLREVSISIPRTGSPRGQHPSGQQTWKSIGSYGSGHS